MFGLVDCNNFYCSCERVFNPGLRTQPVVVLSNNDGCIIARSNEAKALGIEMGTPFYQAKELLEREKVAVFSSNYTLYGDMSRRVMMLLSEFTPELMQYSIDEAFIDLRRSIACVRQTHRAYHWQGYRYPGDAWHSSDQDLGKSGKQIWEEIQRL